MTAAFTVLFALASQQAFSASLPPACQSAIDAECVTDCFVHIKNRPCDGPMVAVDNAMGKGEGWKCYSPSTLDSNFTKYESGSCYCSRDSEIKTTLANTPGCTPPTPPPAPGPVVCVNCTAVFYPGLGGSHCFRIPTITKTAKGTLLAFAENRKADCGDNGDHDLVLRRSSDDGATWGPMQTVRQGTPPCTGCPAAVSNPNPVEVTLANAINQTAKKALLLHYDTLNNPTASRHGLDMQIWSFDEGATWVNSSVIAYPPIKNVGTMVGPSQGIQSEAGTIYFVAHGGSTGNFLYWSKDLGRSWTPSAVFTGGNECSIAFRKGAADGSIIMNCRTGEHKRAQFLWGADGVMQGGITYVCVAGRVESSTASLRPPRQALAPVYRDANWPLTPVHLHLARRHPTHPAHATRSAIPLALSVDHDHDHAATRRASSTPTARARSLGSSTPAAPSCTRPTRPLRPGGRT
jgi:hypothetical protein